MVDAVEVGCLRARDADDGKLLLPSSLRTTTTLILCGYRILPVHLVSQETNIDHSCSMCTGTKMMRRFLDLLVLLSSFSCLEGSRSFVIQPKQWDYKGHQIAFEVSQRVTSNRLQLAGRSNVTEEPTSAQFDSSDKEKEPILLLNGFGVGSFHQHRLIPRLLEDDNRHVYCIDYLGQGNSWPVDCEDGMSENERGLIYSAET
jgi:hypothetical protein